MVTGLFYVEKLKTKFNFIYTHSYFAFKFYFMYMRCDSMHFFFFFFLCTTCVPGVPRGQKKESESLDLKLHLAVSCHVDAGNEPWSAGRIVSALNHWSTSCIHVNCSFPCQFLWCALICELHQIYWSLTHSCFYIHFINTFCCPENINTECW